MLIGIQQERAKEKGDGKYLQEVIGIYFGPVKPVFQDDGKV